MGRLRTASRSAPATFDAYADEYEDALHRGLRYSGEDSTYFARGRLHALARRLRDLGQEPGVTLDFGCGTGAGTALLVDLIGARRAIGVDVSSRSLSIASAHHRRDDLEFHPRTLRLANSVGCAYSNGVFHHIPPDERNDELAYVLSALVPGGLFALCENNPWNPGTRLVMRSIPFDRAAAPLTAPEAQRLLKAGGFEVVSTDFLFVFPRSLRALRPLEKHLQRWPLGAQYMVLARKPRNGSEGLR